MKKKKIKGIQITGEEIQTYSGVEKDLSYVKKFIEMTVDFTDGDNMIITSKDLENILNEKLIVGEK